MLLKGSTISMVRCPLQKAVQGLILFCLFLSLLGTSGEASGERGNSCLSVNIPKKIDVFLKSRPDLKKLGKRGRWIALDYAIKPTDVREGYKCISSKMENAYKKSGLEVASHFRKWMKVNEKSFYAPANNYGWANIFVNDHASKYKLNRFVSKFTEGSIIAKESFVFDLEGRIEIGPLFFMVKMHDGYNPSANDWKFVEVELNGQSDSSDENASADNQRCIHCHSKRKSSDFLYFIKDKI